MITNASGGSASPGILLDTQYDWYFIQRASDLRERTLRAIGALLESGSYTVTKSDVHERLENHASYLLIDTPEYGHWDEYEPFGDQLPIGGETLTKFDLIVTSDQPTLTDYDVTPFDLNTAIQYLSEARAIMPTVSESMTEEIESYPYSSNERLDSDHLKVLIQSNSVRRFTEATARLDRSKVVETHHLDYVTLLIEQALRGLGLLLDPEEGEYDKDTVETGRSKIQRDRVKGLKGIIRELQEKHDDKPGAPEQKVLESALQEEISKKLANHEIQKLRDKGAVYSPDQDHLRLV